MLSGCGINDARNLGTWKCGSKLIELKDGQVIVRNGQSEWRGKYTVNDNRISISIADGAQGLPFPPSYSIRVINRFEAGIYEGNGDGPIEICGR